MESELIIGIHSIVEALKNPQRTNKIVYVSEEALDELRKKHRIDLSKLSDVSLRIMPNHQVQEEAQKKYRLNDFEFHRVPSNLFLEVSPTPIKDLSWLYEELFQAPRKILALDQVTDVHNAAAIMRSAAFYGVHSILFSKGNFRLPPSFSRIASGALEHVSLVNCSSLSSALTKLKDKSVDIVGFSEHAEESGEANQYAQSTCLVLGAEDVGLSHAVSRVVNRQVALISQGPIKSLNVSVAAAIAMERFFKKV